jgi:riboflavin synthase
MFTGLVEERGEVVCVNPADSGSQMSVRAPAIGGDVRVGESIAVNGCCLTVSVHRGDLLTFDLLLETIQRTNLGGLVPGAPVNLERALAATARLGGHFVQGHIDCTSTILGFAPENNDYRLEIELPKEFAQYVAFKGSIAVDGISLTVAELTAKSFVVWIIPHTLAATNLRTRGPGDRVNLEFDLLAKYVARMLTERALP